MAGPTPLLYSLAAIMLVTSVYCFSRLVAARRWHRSIHWDVDVAHVAMGVAMAGMFVAALRTLPAAVWEVIFGCLTLWFSVQIGRFVHRRGLSGWDQDARHHVTHHAAHLVMALAMLYMFVVLGAPSATSTSRSVLIGMAGGNAGSMSGVRSGLPIAFLTVLVVSAVWHADGLGRFSPVRPSGTGQRPAGTGVFHANWSPATTARPAAHEAGPPENPSAAPAALLSAAAPATLLSTPPPVAVLSVGEISAVRQRSDGPVVLGCQDGRWLAPRLGIACHVAMCVAMAYMLVTLR